MAYSALKHYDLPSDAQINFLGQSQNTTFRVETLKGDKFLLRVHVGMGATDDGSLDVWQEMSAIQSELLWLDALRRDTSLTVSQPVRNQSGNWVSEVSNTSFQKPFRCTLLHWIDGQQLETEITREQVHRVGALMAQLHQHANQWQLPPGFVRPKHDEAQLQASLLRLHALTKQGTISIADYEIFQEATEQIQQLMLNLERTSDTWGVIHADLQEANYLFYGDEVRPIDFARCGFGFYLYDVGLSLGYLQPQMRSDFLVGYQSLRSLPTNYQRIVEAFFISSIVENFAFLSANPREHEWLSNAVPDVAHNNFRPYLQGEAFLFEK